VANCVLSVLNKENDDDDDDISLLAGLVFSKYCKILFTSHLVNSSLANLRN